MTIELDDINTLNAQPIVEWRPGQRTIVVNAEPEPNPDPDEWIEDTNRTRSALLKGGYEL